MEKQAEHCCGRIGRYVKQSQQHPRQRALTTDNSILIGIYAKMCKQLSPRRPFQSPHNIQLVQPRFYCDKRRMNN